MKTMVVIGAALEVAAGGLFAMLAAIVAVWYERRLLGRERWARRTGMIKLLLGELREISAEATERRSRVATGLGANTPLPSAAWSVLRSTPVLDTFPVSSVEDLAAAYSCVDSANSVLLHANNLYYLSQLQGAQGRVLYGDARRLTAAALDRVLGVLPAALQAVEAELGRPQPSWPRGNWPQ